MLLGTNVSAARTDPAEEAPGPSQALKIHQLVGERLTFSVRWGPIPAGEAVLAVEAGEGRRVQLVATARTLPAIDALYRVRDRMVSVVRPDLASFTYSKSSEEGKRRRQETIKFDLGVGLARYQRDDRLPTVLEVPKNVRDPLSSLYAFRLFDLDPLVPSENAKPELPGTSPATGAVRFPVSDGRRLIHGEVAIIGREIVQTPAGRFNTIVVQPQLEGIGGVFKKSPGAAITIWLTDDEFKRPVKMASAVAVGKFVAELVKLETSAAAEP